MKTRHFNVQHISLVILIFLMPICSCSSGSDDNSASESKSDSMAMDNPMSVNNSEESNQGLSISVGIPFDPSISEADVLSYYAKEENGIVNIFPNSGYFKRYCSEDEMEFNPERDVYCSDYIDNPQVQVYITNNSDKVLTFDKLRVDVHSSKLDTFPLIYIEQAFTRRFGMDILNESWTNWGKMTIEYSFEKRGKPFNGKYDYFLIIPYFEDCATINFRPDIIAEGFDCEKLNRYIELNAEENYYNPPVYGHSTNSADVIFARLVGPNFSPELLSDLAYPFMYGYGMDNQPYIFTRIHARISFSKSKFKKKITGIIPLTCFYPGGAQDELVDEFDVLLKPVGTNYYVDLPYVTTLQPGCSERIQLRIKCDKSSRHNMNIQLFSDNQGVFISKPINFYNVNGRHSSYHVLKSYEE